MQPLKRPAGTDYHSAGEADFSKAYCISLTTSSREKLYPSCNTLEIRDARLKADLNSIAFLGITIIAMKHGDQNEDQTYYNLRLSGTGKD